MTRTATNETSTRRFSLRAKLAVAVLLTAATVLGTLAVMPADAATYWTSGSVGHVTVPQGRCEYKPVWNQLNASLNAPSIYARNFRSGGGNDADWVRYRVFVVNRHNQFVLQSGYSAWVKAYDNSPAQFSGATSFTKVPDHVRLVVQVEWWNTNGSVSSLAHHVDRYTLISNGTGPFGPLDSCAKWVPPSF